MNLAKSILPEIDSLAELGSGMLHPAGGADSPGGIDADLLCFCSRGLRNPFQMRFFRYRACVRVGIQEYPRRLQHVAIVIQIMYK